MEMFNLQKTKKIKKKINETFNRRYVSYNTFVRKKNKNRFFFSKHKKW